MSLIKPFKGNFRISQIFGVNPQDYAKFNLAGHNGIDYATPQGTPLIAPCDGIVIEVDYEENGYGNYVHVESATEGFILGHLCQVDVKLGFEVKQGDKLGLSGNTGNSTGPHVHFGYYRVPRDRSNGFNGYINPQPYLDIIESDKPMESVTVSTANLNTYGLDPTNLASEQVVYTTWHDVTSGVYVKKADFDTLTKVNTELNDDLKTLQERFNVNFDLIAKIQALGFNTLDDLHKVIDPYKEMYQAGFTSLKDINDKIKILTDQIQSLSDAVKASAPVVAQNVDLTTQVNDLTTKVAVVNPDSLYTKLAQFLEIMKNLCKIKNATPITPVVVEEANKALSAWEEFSKSVRGSNN